MPAPIIDDELWKLIEPLLRPPKPRRKRYPGRLPVTDRAALNGILLVLKIGMRWNHLPTRLGFGSRATCWRRLHDWQQARVWDKLHGLLLDKLRESARSISHTRLSIHCPCEPMGRPKNWAKPHRSRTTKIQTLRPRRRERRSCQRYPERRESQRCHATAVAGRHHPADSRRTRPTASQAQGHLRRPRLRLRLASPPTSRVVASDRLSSGVTSNTAAALAKSVGSSNGLIRGSMVSVVSHSR